MVAIRPITNTKLYGLVAGYIVVGLWSLFWVWIAYTNVNPSSPNYNTSSGLSWIVSFAVVAALCGLIAIKLYWSRTLSNKVVLTLWVAPVVAVLPLTVISPIFPTIASFSVVGPVPFSAWSIFLEIEGVPLFLVSFVSMKIIQSYGSELVSVHYLQYADVDPVVVPATASDKLPKALAGRYSQATFRGEGGFARVFAATRQDGTRVALKVPKDVGEAAGKLFIREAANWSTLKHENIVRLDDFNIFPVPYLEAELCDWQLEGMRLDVSQAVSVVLDVAQGIRYAHKRLIIHGDIKPSNILLKGGKAKLSDWGLSKLKAAGKSTTVVGATLEYAAPEELSAEFGRVDERTDIWQLGAVFYQLLTGRLPFEGTAAQLQYAITHTDPLPPSCFMPAASNLDPVVTRCLQKRKDDRYRSMDELISALEAYKPPRQFCNRCGTPLLAEARFCRQCGTIVSEQSVKRRDTQFNEAKTVAAEDLASEADLERGQSHGHVDERRDRFFWLTGIEEGDDQNH